jgi:hypothetical protein
MTSITPCFFRHWFQPAGIFTRKNFQNVSGLSALSLSGFWLRPRFRVVGNCIRSVVVILPIGSKTPVDNIDFNISVTPARLIGLKPCGFLLLLASAQMTKLLPDLLFLPCAALR